MFWPLILIDLYTEEGVIGRAYLEPYISKSMRYLIPAPHDLGEMLKVRVPVERDHGFRSKMITQSGGR
jgi:mandelate racemase